MDSRLLTLPDKALVPPTLILERFSGIFSRALDHLAERRQRADSDL